MVIGYDDELLLLNYCRESSVYKKKGMTKWFKMAEPYVKYRFVNYREYKDYSEGELVKLKDYDKVCDDIIKDILEHINPNYPTKIAIEGYNFASNGGDIIDLVTFSTLLRKKLFDLVSEDITVLSPMTLKLEACKLSYEPIRIEKGKRVIKIVEEYKNNLGIPGGKFIKMDMFYAIIENKYSLAANIIKIKLNPIILSLFHHP